jgi:hypothetical protein
MDVAHNDARLACDQDLHVNGHIFTTQRIVCLIEMTLACINPATALYYLYRRAWLDREQSILLANQELLCSFDTPSTACMILCRRVDIS